ncbi:Rrf2 family transcriptional regulator [Candidatus Gracilibacteria bacterium]|nr:Rrf2 family transcriptional regulator [Candidatus Gracilibacteria bacterium]
MIKLSKTGDIALKALCYIAQKHPERVQIKEIASDQDLSESHLRQIIVDLSHAAMVETKQGRNGGVRLLQNPNQVSIYDIFGAVGEEMGITDCTKDIYCDKKDSCITTNVLGNLQKGFNSLLKLHTLDKIIQK